jgi:hypothetical protein
MYEWRDETTRKGQSTPERFAQSRTDKIRKEEREINNEALSNERLNNSSHHTPPADFKVTDELRQWAMLNYPEVNIDEETAKFRNWEQPSSRSDWDAAWRLWIQRDSERQRNSEPTADKAISIRALRKLGKELNIVPKPGESDDDYLGRVERANDKRIDDLNL